MSGSLGTLTLDLIAKIGGFTGPLDQAGRSARKSSKEMVDAAKEASAAWSALAGAAAGVVGAFSVASIFGRFLTETRNAEQEQAQLGAVLRSTGESAGFNRDQLNEMAGALEKATTFSGGDINQAQTTLLAFTGIVGNQFNRALQAAADMAARTGMSVKDAAETIGRALDVPSKGLTALSKQGFRFTEDQKKMALAMESTGNVAGAQGIILQSLEESYGGAAAAARDTFGGAMEALQNTISGLLTGEDSLTTAKDVVEVLNKALGSPEAKVALEATAKAAVVLAGVLTVRLAAAAASTAVSFLAAQIEAARYQATLARMAGVSATAAAGITAVGLAARAASAAMGLLGGPAGIIIAAGAALTYFATKTKDARQSLVDIGTPIDEIAEKFRNLGRDQKAAQLAQYTADFEKATQDQADAYSMLMKRVNRDLGSSLFPRIKKEFDDAYAAGQPLSVVIEDLSRRFRLKPEALQAWVAQSGAVAEAGEKASYAASLVKRLTDEFNANTAAATANAGAVPERSKVYEDLSKKIREQLVLAGKRTEADKLEARIKAGLVDGLKDGEGELLVAEQRRADAANRAADATKKAEEDAKSRAKSAAEALKKRGVDAEEGYRRQIALIDETTGKQGKATEVAKLAFELETGKLKGVSAERRKVLEGLAAELDAKIKLQRQNQEDLKLATYAANLKDSNTIVRQGFELEIAGAGQGEKLRSRMRESLAIEQEFAKQRGELYKQYKEADLLGDPDAKARYDKETALLRDAMAERMEIQQDYYAKQDEMQSNWLDGVSDAWQNFADEAQNYSAMAADATTSVLGSARGELSSFLSDVATGSKDAGDALMDMITGFAKAGIRALTDMAAQWLVYQAVQLVVGKTTQSTAGLAMVANAQATAFQASLAAFASTAAIPIVGPAAAPAAAAAAAAATAPMVAGVASAALTGMAHDGIDNIPREGTWLLDGGERVLNPNQNRDLTQYLRSANDAGGGAGQGGGITINAPVTVQAQAGMSEADARRQGDLMGQAVTEQVRDVLYREMQQGGLLWRNR
ncbi:phage tail tape measure C-terminal domain-containing protein [Pseudomonas entomophila]|uniref:phage tail tape measure C-terminal domain-containing protein n=1 Tax=Pseudomonas entomophila TaxID=312306 RepID=UPI0023D7BCAB|nr:phage tail length tape measure family protein [Pseudomonas entomophila]MDF0731015.1 phage tail tape measure C-terminal domain-containing protein [Pseudomonas entomophila]